MFNQILFTRLKRHKMYLLGTLSVLFKLCPPGHICEVLPTPCARPGPCQPVATCVKKPRPNPGTCPKLTGLLECSHGCTTDSDCGAVLKCCSHTCGRKCVQPQPTITPQPQYPCNHVKCSLGFECRLRHDNCPSKHCPVNPQCVPASLPPTKPRCRIGRPVLDENNVEWDCGNNSNSRHCPGDTVCNIKYGVCCFNDQTGPEPNLCDGFKCSQGEECRVETIVCITFPCPGRAPVCRPTNKIGSCPSNLPIQRKPCTSKCTNDADCAGTLKCCGGCTRECTVAAPPIPKEKPGSCPKPKPGFVGPCFAECGTDFECPGTKKCCGSCPRVCTDVEPIVPKEKPGSCPKPTGGLIGICVARCTFDSECKDDQKCCGSCPRECVSPVQLPPKEKPGSCPKPIPGSIGPCFATCSFDSDCAGDLKCCGNCPRQCTAVTIPRVKPGFCPISHDSGSSICLTQCSDDFSCPRDSKCCVSGCRRICKRLLLDAPYVDSDPCKRQKCGINQVCKLQKEVCKRAPCYPTAICLDKSLEDSSSVCRSGYPVVDMNSKPLSCFRACPDGTSCVKRSCCWNKEVKPPGTGSCPVVYGRRQRFRCRSNPRCQTDRTCPSGRKCCRVGRCGKRCVPVN